MSEADREANRVDAATRAAVDAIRASTAVPGGAVAG